MAEDAAKDSADDLVILGTRFFLPESISRVTLLAKSTANVVIGTSLGP